MEAMHGITKEVAIKRATENLLECGLLDAFEVPKYQASLATRDMSTILETMAYSHELKEERKAKGW